MRKRFFSLFVIYIVFLCKKMFPKDGVIYHPGQELHFTNLNLLIPRTRHAKYPMYKCIWLSGL